ncbi:SRPBCC family protein [Nocardioides iriomotensis]|uniref:SRPBCC domain-containing protein n=1 Tax=Nocardioides iriomotensis TaxID=715784 RepID=A0A4Q5ISN8_9ACTN|nr:SRPBCC domain-containing protein [Nocardioides iriomotensis]RYU08784.1 SRPBCC domain-containing protein [Nocardioides iriomotensis]
MSRTDQPFSVAYSLSRLLPADPCAVFAAWTTATGLAAWLGPEEYDVPSGRAVMDARAGGTWGLVMVAPDGSESRLGGKVREVDHPRRLVLTTGDPANTAGDTASVVTLQLVSAGDGTSMHFHQAGVNTSSEHAEQARQGWLHFFDRLERHLRST